MSLQLVQGDNGIIVSGTVLDDGRGRTLTGASIVLKFKVGSGVTHDVACVADADQVTNPGRFTGTLSSVHLAAAGGVNAEVQVTDGANVITYGARGATVGTVRAQL
jgi:hypothetical protein